MRRRILTPVLALAVAALTAACGGSKQLRAVQAQRYISSIPLSTDIESVTRDLGTASARASYEIGRRRIELLFYRTSASASSIGIVCASRYTPLLFEAGRLIAVGWETERPEFTRQQTEELLALVSAGEPAGKMLKKDLAPDTQKQQAP